MLTHEIFIRLHRPPVQKKPTKTPRNDKYTVGPTKITSIVDRNPKIKFKINLEILTQKRKKQDDPVSRTHPGTNREVNENITASVRLAIADNVGVLGRTPKSKTLRGLGSWLCGRHGGNESNSAANS